MLKDFLENNRNRIMNILHDENRRLQVYKFQLEDKYTKKMKNSFSFFGTVKPKNVIHNEYVLKEREFDRKFDYIKDNYEKVCNIFDKIKFNEDISIDEANEILKMENSQFLEDIIPFIKGAVGVGLVLLVCLIT